MTRRANGVGAVSRRDTRGLIAFTGMIALACVVSTPFIARLSALHPGPPATVVAIAALFAVSEIALINIPLQRDTHTISLNEVPLTLGLFLLSPTSLLVAGPCGSLMALGFHRHQRGVKLAFNVAQVGAQCLIATVLFRAVRGSSSALSARSYAAVLLAAVSADFASGVLVTCAIRLYRGTWKGVVRAWTMMFGSAASIAKTSVALVALSVVLRDDWTTAIPLIVTVACTFAALKAYAALVERHQRLAMLYRFTNAIGQCVRLDDIARAIIIEARELFRSSQATLSIARKGADHTVWSTNVEHEGSVEVEILRPCGEGSETACDGGDRAGRIVGSSQLRNGSIASLAVQEPVAGAEFDEIDRRLFDALVAQASIALDAGILFDELECEMRDREFRNSHDAVTGLVNRERFVQLVDERLATGEECVVLVIAVDDFADIKETVGHEYSNDVLREVAARLVDTCGREATVAYLIGEEFAVLWPGGTTYICRTLSEVLTAEMTVDALPINVPITIGCAIAPDHAPDANTLLRLADGALRRARQSNDRFAVHDPHTQSDARRRLTLAHDLRRALHARDLVPYFQPKVDLRNERLVGVEALVRWPQPGRQPVMPDAFIPVAEHTGLIDGITKFMLDATLAQRRQWIADGLTLDVAINVSARNLLDPKFGQLVMRSLIRHECPPRALTVELTESQLMSDPERAVRALQELHDLGVKIAIDDFGTGFSSLTLLRSLPIDELKIDRSFVMNVTGNANDAAIVRSTANLASNLGLGCVAEGIEHEPARQFLVDVGVLIGQGHMFAQPLPAPEFQRWSARAEHRDGALR